jgi:flagellar protein FlbD
VFILLSRGPFSLCALESHMIVLTRLNGQSFVVNAEKIRYVESTPDTIVCCESGEKMMVKEPLPEVMRRAIEYARTIRKPVTE